MKEYRTMTEQERTDWMARFAEFLKEDYANVKSQGEGWKTSFEHGLDLLKDITIAEEFVRTSREFMDYERRIERMAFFVEEMRRQVIEIDGDVLSRIVVQTKRRVGRPTKEEAREYARQEQEEQSGKMESLAMIAGVALPEKEKKAPKEDEKPEAVVGDLFAEPKGVQTKKTESVPGGSREEGTKLRLQDIKHLLDGDLQEAVDTVAMLRSRAATESELAKELAMNGGTQEEIAKHAKAACECTNAYEDIYARVDMALARLYVSTNKDNPIIKRGETKESQLAKTEPYYQKVLASGAEIKEVPASAVSEEKENEPLDKQKEHPSMSKADKAALLHKYRTFFMRKGVKNTKQRIERMEQIIAELKAMNVQTDEYEVVMNVAKKELNKK